MNLEELFDRLIELFDESWRMPLSSGKAVVDVLEATELVRELRNNLPAELDQAKRIVEERKEIVTTARREAEVMIKNAEEKARFLTSREEIVAAANREANEIILEAKRQAGEVLKQATEQATEQLNMANKQASEQLADTSARVKEMRTTTNDYVEQVLAMVEKCLSQAAGDVRQAQQNFKNARL
ncbi:MAG: hypothetical protein IJF59_03940 [Clostridia bacterium]|nr:hypothetical protein [Clostridia bacterium]